MYEFAYNEIVEESSQSMRAQEARALDRVIGLLRQAEPARAEIALRHQRALSAAHTLDGVSR